MKEKLQILMKQAIFLAAIICVLSLSACAGRNENLENIPPSEAKLTEENGDMEKESSVNAEAEETKSEQIQWQVYISPDVPEPFTEVLKQYEEFMNAENQNLNDENVERKLAGGEWRYLYDELCGSLQSWIERKGAEDGDYPFCYSLTDLTGDDFPELVMGYDSELSGKTPEVIYYFSEKDGIKMECLSCYYTMTLYAGGILEYESGGAAYTKTYCQFQEDTEEWQVKDILAFFWNSVNEEKPEYGRLKWIEGAEVIEPLSLEECLQIEAKYTAEPVEMEWVPLVQGKINDYYEPTEVSQLDYDSFQSRMTDEEWEGFQQYFPVLKENVSFQLADFGNYTKLNKDGDAAQEGESVIFYRYISEEVTDINSFVKGYAGDGIEEMLIQEVRVFDLDGDGVRELILKWTPVGDFLVLHRENEDFYGWNIMYRGFEALQTNGVYVSSGGARSNRFHCIRFDNGSWLEENLFEEDWGEYYLNGEPTDEDTFLQQVDAYMTGDVTGYEPKRRVDGDISK